MATAEEATDRFRIYARFVNQLHELMLQSKVRQAVKLIDWKDPRHYQLWSKRGFGDIYDLINEDRINEVFGPEWFETIIAKSINKLFAEFSKFDDFVEELEKLRHNTDNKV